MKVLVVTVRADVGGGPEHIWQLLKAWQGRLQAFVAAPEEAPYAERFRDAGATQAVVLPHRSFSVRKLLEVMRYIRREGIDLIHSHGKGAGIYGRLAALLTGRPCVHTFHGLHIESYGELGKGLYLALERMLEISTHTVIAVSAGEAADMVDHGLGRRVEIVTIPNGVVVPQVAAPRPKPGVGRIVVVTRYDHQKNTEAVVPIVGLMNDLIPGEWQVVVAGDGEGRKAFESAVGEAGLDHRIQVVGNQPSLRPWLSGAACLLSTSRWEGMSLAVLEAFSEGVPVVASDVIGNRDVIAHGSNGLLYPLDDAAAAAEAIGRLLGDARLRADMGDTAFSLATCEYSAATMAKRTLDVLEMANER